MKDEKNRNVYVGHRYVPKVFGEWDKGKEYEGLSIVTNKGTSYTSKKRVPIGIDILDEEYWSVTGNYNAQIEEYRKDVRKMQGYVEKELDEANKKIDNKITNLTEEVDTSIKEIDSKVDNKITDLTEEVDTKVSITVSKTEPNNLNVGDFWYEVK